MITEHIKLAALYDPVKEINLTEPRKLMEFEVIDTVEKLCKDGDVWKSYGEGGCDEGVARQCVCVCVFRVRGLALDRGNETLRRVTVDPTGQLSTWATPLETSAARSAPLLFFKNLKRRGPLLTTDEMNDRKDAAEEAQLCFACACARARRRPLPRGSIGLKSGINFFWGPGVEPPPRGEQVAEKHHTTTHGEIMVFRMKNMCQELVGILPEEEWYADYVLKNKKARKAVCDRKGQMCAKYPTQKFIDEYDPSEKPRPLFSGGGANQAKKVGKKKQGALKGGAKKEGKDEL